LASGDAAHIHRYIDDLGHAVHLDKLRLAGRINESMERLDKLLAHLPGELDLPARTVPKTTWPRYLPYPVGGPRCGAVVEPRRRPYLLAAPPEQGVVDRHDNRFACEHQQRCHPPSSSGRTCRI
jgi:hypothetical protein